MCLNLDRQPDRWSEVTKRFDRIGAGGSVERLAAVDHPANPHVGVALSHRAAVDRAERAGWEHVLVFEDDVLFHPAVVEMLPLVVAELADRPWALFFLGAMRWGIPSPAVEGCRFLHRPVAATTTHAVAYHRSAFPDLLESWPADVDGMTAWIDDHIAIDQWFAHRMRAVPDWPVFIAEPALATQPNLVGEEPPARTRRELI